MRDPKRIQPLLKKIEEIWLQVPDLRLCQLIGNCFPSGDTYYVEDEELEKKLNDYVKSSNEIKRKLGLG